MNSWVGHPINDYIATNGITPSQVLPDGGGQMFIFGVSQTGYYQMPTTTNAQVTSYGNTAYGTANTYGGGAIPITSSCNWVFRTDSRGYIRSWSYRGNACKSKPNQ
jgi:hypothetical protein